MGICHSKIQGKEVKLMRENSNRRPGGKMRRAKKKVCAFCSDKSENIDYKDVAKLRKYVTERGRWRGFIHFTIVAFREWLIHHHD